MLIYSDVPRLKHLSAENAAEELKPGSMLIANMDGDVMISNIQAPGAFCAPVAPYTSCMFMRTGESFEVIAVADYPKSSVNRTWIPHSDVNPKKKNRSLGTFDVIFLTKERTVLIELSVPFNRLKSIIDSGDLMYFRRAEPMMLTLVSSDAINAVGQQMHHAPEKPIVIMTNDGDVRETTCAQIKKAVSGQIGRDAVFTALYFEDRPVLAVRFLPSGDAAPFSPAPEDQHFSEMDREVPGYESIRRFTTREKGETFIGHLRSEFVGSDGRGVVVLERLEVNGFNTKMHIRSEFSHIDMPNPGDATDYRALALIMGAGEINLRAATKIKMAIESGELDLRFLNALRNGDGNVS